jgi:penicillin-binding protein 1A
MGNPAPQRVFSYGETYAATQVLKTVITQGTGTAANYGCPAAGKTGTAENEDNAWFVGYTPKISTGVWVGYPQGNISMGTYGFGGTAAAPIWHDYMLSASNGFCGDWAPPTTPWTGTAFVGPHSAKGPPVGPGGGLGSRGGSGGRNGGGNARPGPAGPGTVPGGGGAGGGGQGGGGGGQGGGTPGGGGGGGGGGTPGGGNTGGGGVGGGGAHHH